MTGAKLAGALGGVVAGALIWTYCLWADAFVASQIWRWFAVPAGLPAVEMRVFVLVSLFATLFQYSPRQPKEEKQTIATRAISELLKPWMVLGIAALVRVVLS